MAATVILLYGTDNVYKDRRVAFFFKINFIAAPNSVP